MTDVPCVLDLGAKTKWDKALVRRSLGPNAHYVNSEDGGELFARGHGGVIIAPVGKAHDDVPRGHLCDLIGQMDWVVLFLTSDEGSTFRWDSVTHPNMRMWIQTPRPKDHRGHDRVFPFGAPPGTPEILGPIPWEKDIEWSFAGQVNHERREKLVKGLRRRQNGILLPTEGFSQGFDREEYLGILAHTKIVPAPSGPLTPDSFRLWEALEAGCVPLVDIYCPNYEEEYWPFVLDRWAPFPLPLVQSWSNVNDMIDHQLSLWPANAVRASAWWQQFKRSMYWSVQDDIAEVSRMAIPTEKVTILVPTSPIQSHPSTEIIEETLRSIRFHFPASEILVMCDGVRSEQESRRAAYEDYLYALMKLCQNTYHATPIVFDEHTHQIGMTRHTLEMVRTPTILFVEHDTPLVTDEPIEWGGIIPVVEQGRVNVMRFHHEALVLEVHKHLMVDKGAHQESGVPCQRTLQWSQRPHLANTEYYRRLLDRVAHRKGMIEDAVISYTVTEPWGAHRVAIYTPGGPAGIKRSLNLDGRGDDPKWTDS